MTDDDFLAAMGIQKLTGEDSRPLPTENPLADVLQIDDARSDYCEQLENRVVVLTKKIEVLKSLVRALLRS